MPFKKEAFMSENLMARRDFMKTSVTGLGGFAMLASNEIKPEEKKQSAPKLIYRTLGKTGIKVPVIGMGSAAPPEVFEAALNAGLMLFDTAQSYGRGQHESMMGKLTKGRPRNSFVVCTKSWPMRDRITGLFTQEVKEDEFLRGVEGSLKRLEVEYADLFLIHDVWTVEGLLFKSLMNGLEKAKKLGLVKFIGAAFHREEVKLIRATIDSKIYDVIQVTYNFKQRHFLQVREAIAQAAQAGLGVMAMKVMGGSDAQDHLRPVNAKAALKWVLQDPNVHTTIPGFRNFEELNVDISVMEDLSLTDKEKEHLQKQASIPGLYCQGCGQCMKQCSARIPIPDLMRAYMYTYGYRDVKQGYELITSLDLPRSICQDCSQCSVKCSIGFDVPKKIQNIARLRDVPSEFIV
jgi:predicted aldo/keto reductase-like oxidoreductase